MAVAKVHRASLYDLQTDTTTVIVGTRAYLARRQCAEEAIGPEIDVPDNLVNFEGKHIGTSG